MISHKHKFIFIHIPKCAGSSIRDFLFDNPKLNWKVPNYELLYGWCPERQLHLQHATPQQLVETELIPKDVWDSYFKFTIVRNPWDRAYSDYLWIQKDCYVSASFRDYINRAGDFEKVLNDNTEMSYRGDHLTLQVDYALSSEYPLDYVGRFENLKQDIDAIKQQLNIEKPFVQHQKKSKKKWLHYSLFYTNSYKTLVEKSFSDDIIKLNYIFEDQRKGFHKFKKLI